MVKEKIIYELDNGTQTTVRSHFVRQEFVKGKSRKEIVKMLQEMGDPVSYGTIASATANMDNGTLVNRGRVFLEFENGKKFPRKEYIIDQIINKKRTVVELKEELNISYDSVYAAIKGLQGVTKQHGGKVKIKLEDGTEIYRTDYIRKRWSEGAKVREIATETSCEYTIVYNTLFRKKKKEGANNVNKTESQIHTT